jgi:hypothetical protein
MKTKTKTPESSRFDSAIRTILSVSHDELTRREKEWKKGRKKRIKISASGASV